MALAHLHREGDLMPLSVKPRIENEIAILELEGPLTLGPSLHALRDTARDVLAREGLRGVIVDVTHINATDSAGLGELTVVYTFSSRRQCRVMLAGASQALRTMLEVTHLDGLLPNALDLSAAKKALLAS